MVSRLVSENRYKEVTHTLRKRSRPRQCDLKNWFISVSMREIYILNEFVVFPVFFHFLNQLYTGRLNTTSECKENH